MVLALLDESDLCLSDSTVETIVDNVTDTLLLSACHQVLVCKDHVSVLTRIISCCSVRVGVQTFSQADSNGDGRIDPEEWEEFVKKNPATLRNMTLPYLQCVA
jgi:serine/threonine-protein phosphatase 2B regulatory subunit